MHDEEYAVSSRSGAPSLVTPVMPTAIDRPSVAALAGAIERLGQVVDQESDALSARQPVDLQEFAHRKSRGLLELTRLMQGIDLAGIGPDLRIVIAGLSEKLQANAALLKTHLQAVQELAAIIARTMRDAESDGTYSVAGQRSAKRA